MYMIKAIFTKTNMKVLNCTPCETFWPESQVTGNLCPDCKRELEKISETNFFFKIVEVSGLAD